MQNGRNRIAAHGRRKAGKSSKPNPKPGKAPAPPEFPKEVAVATPPGMTVPKSFPAKSPKPRPARRKPQPPVRQRRPGRKQRAAAREAEHRRQTALVVAEPRKARPPKPASHPATPDVICLPQVAMIAEPAPAEAAALPLPEVPEPLVLEHDDKKWEPVFVEKSCDNRNLEPGGDSTKRHQALAAIPRHHAVARPARSLVAAISAWLGSARRLLALNLLPRKPRKPLPKPPRSLAEVNRIAAENAARRQRPKVDA